MILKAENFFGITTSNVNLIAKYYANVDFNSTTYTRWPTGSRGLQIYSSNLGSTYLYFGITGSNAVSTGFAFKHVEAAAEGILVTFRNNATTHVNLSIQPGGTVVARLAGSTEIFSYTIPNFSLNNWYYLETGIVVADTSGSLEFKVNGKTAVSMSGIDTKNGTTSTIDEVGTESFRQNNRWYITDWYITNNQGPISASNTFLGDIKILSFLPSQSGDTIQFTPSASTNVSQVDDGNSPDDDTTFVSASLVDTMDLFRAQIYTGSEDIIYGVSVRTLARKTDAGSREFVNVIKSGSSFGFSPSQSLGNGYAYYTDIFETNPSTGVAFTNVQQAINTQFGYKIVK